MDRSGSLGQFEGILQPDFEITGMADLIDSAEFSVSSLYFPRRGRELNAAAP
jgi:hypothetical protein